MRKLTYLAVFEPAEKGYNVSFPDLPGCISYGENFEKARGAATRALGFHLYSIEKNGDEIPAPSPTPKVDPGTAAGFLVSPITIFPDLVRNDLDNRAVRTNLTIPAWLKEMAEAQGVNYSKIFRVALRDYLGISKYPG